MASWENMELPTIFIDIRSQETFQNGILEVLSKIRPNWVPRSEFIHKTFSGGLTNKLVGVYMDGKKEDMVLIRIYGQNSDVMIDRKKEVRNMKLLHHHGCGAELFAIFKNGIAYQYLSGSILSIENIRESNIFPKVAVACAKMHSIPAPPSKDGSSFEKEACLWNLLRKFQSHSPDGFPQNQEMDEYYQKVIQYSKTELAIEIDKMQSLLANKALKKSKIVFCHNDLMPTNILINETSKQHANESLFASFIDYEYGDWNYREYDIANHFNEFVGLPDERTGQMNYEKLYPSKDFRLKWLKEYIKHTNLMNGDPVVEPTQQEIDELDDMVSYFTPLGHLVWGIWSLVQAKFSDIDFDYINYAAERLKQYKIESSKIL